MFNAKPMVAIVDYGMGNLFSVSQACAHAGLEACITSDKEQLRAAGAVILPGVGAFGDAMQALQEKGLDGALRDFVTRGRPLLGICLGMQLLFTKSEEFGEHAGLNIISGTVKRFADTESVSKVPQVGWNRIYRPAGTNASLWLDSPLADISEGEFMYFVHSYYCQPDDPGISLSATEYAGVEYCSSIRLNNIFACQFHPEKSAQEGLKIYRNFAKAVIKESAEK